MSRRRGNPVRQAKPQVRPAGEPLGVAVRRDKHQRDGRERETERVQRPRRCEKQTGRDEYRGPRLRQREPPRRELPGPGARVLRVQVPIRDPVETERYETRASEREYDEREYSPRSEEHTSELQSLTNLVCRLLLEK